MDIEHYTKASKNYAVVTICTPNFIPGTLVMIYSYLKYNSWFKGDFVILVDEVSPEMKKYLPLMPNVKFQIVGEEIIKRAELVSSLDKTGKIFKSHFYSIELFNLSNYDKLFYVDSDMLVLGSLLELFEMEEPMICVGDSFFYKDQLRDGPAYNLVEPKFWQDKSKFWGGCFNAGLILFDKSMVNPKTYKELTEMIRFDSYSGQAMRLQDQMMQNIYFRDQFKLVSSKYNFRLGIGDQILEKDGVKIEDAVIIHYTARKKPWLHFEALDRALTNKNYMIPFNLWQEHWIELLNELNLKNTL